MNKELYFEDTAKAKLKVGFDKLAKAVSSTLGPNGKTVIIQIDDKKSIITKDGVTVAEHINLSDPVENIGAQMLKEVSLLTNKEAGDGTTTATVLGKAILDGGFKELDSRTGFDIKKELEDDCEEILKKLDSFSKKCKKSDIIKVANVSTNGDSKLSKLIADLYKKSNNSEIILEQSLTNETYTDFIEGYSCATSYLDSSYINHVNKEVRYKSPIYFIYDGKLNSAKEYALLLDKVSRLNRPLVVIAEEVSNDVLYTSFKNLNRIANVIVKTPGFGPVRKQYLNDIAVYTKGEVIGTSNINNVTLNQLGQSKDIIITEDSTIIKGGNYDKESLESYILNLEYATKKNSDHNKKKIKERISKFREGVGVIYIGATSELEYKEKYDRIEDAVNAVKAALEEGVIPGGGSILFSIGHDNDRLLYRAIRKPFGIIKKNILMFDPNVIIDPVKVTKSALKNAVSVASTILTTETVIVNEYS